MAPVSARAQETGAGLIDWRVLKQFGSTNERLKEVFTAVPYDAMLDIPKEQREARDKDCASRKAMEDEIRERLNANILFGLRSYTHYSAADLAWDFTLNPQKIPLLLYAQGKIKIEACTQQLKALPNSDKYLKKDTQGVVTGIDLPRFIEVECNLVRSYVTRRLAAQSNKYSNLWPYYKYEPRSTGSIGKLRGDLMSQRADIMADDFGYRHHDRQVYRDAFLYGHSVDFVRASWEVDKQIQAKPQPEGAELPEDAELEVEDVIVREGISWLNPHPTRVFWDNSSPLASINSDSGCEYLGFWNVVKARDVKRNPAYWNRDQITFGAPLWTIFQNYQAYFNQYFDVITPPVTPQVASVVNDPAAQNDRQNNVGLYAGQQDDTGIFLAEYFRKLVPLDCGIGEYPYPVWVRFTVASDNTVVFAEFLPSTPAAYLGINENDSRLVNVGLSHEVMSYQDQMSNLINLLLSAIQADSFMVIGINTDVIKDQAQRDFIKQRLQGRNWASDPLVIEYSKGDQADVGVDNKESVITLMESKQVQNITSIIQAMSELIQIVEKLMAMSPAEQGQPAPREISATEVNEISATTSSVYNFFSDGIDDFHAAKKKIIYESTMACTKAKEVRLPVVNRYSADTIKKAGFKPIAEEDEDFSDKDAAKRTVLGSVQLLRHDYIFTTRDGAERPTNTQAANTLVQMLGQILAFPAVAQGLGKEKLYSIVNEIFRLSGTGVDLNLEMQEGEDNSLGVDQVQQLAQQVDQLGKMMNEFGQEVKSNAQGLQEQEQVNQEQQQALAQTVGLAQEVKKHAEAIQQITQGPHAKIAESMSYKDVPPSVKRQMEAAAGFKPAVEDDSDEQQQHQEAAKAATDIHVKTINAAVDAQSKAAKTKADLEAKRLKTTQDLRQKEEAHQQNLAHAEQMARVKRDAARQTAAATTE
jgi:hypothetical protein